MKKLLYATLLALFSLTMPVASFAGKKCEDANCTKEAPCEKCKEKAEKKKKKEEAPKE